MKTYSKEEIRKRLMQYHNIDGNKQLSGLEGVREIMKRLGSIQYDPLNVVGQNADLVLQARVDNYSPKDLYSLLYEEHSLTDGTDKEMCIYNTEDYGYFSRIRKANAASEVNTLRNHEQMGIFDILDEVEEFVKAHGKTSTKDISIGEVRESRWGHRKLSSAALNYLYISGNLCVADKKGTIKYFDLTERVIKPGMYQTEEMSEEEFLEWYISRRIKSVGFIWNKNGGAWQGHYINNMEVRKKILLQLVEKDAIETFQIDGFADIFYACKDFFTDSVNSVQKDYSRFIAPLDNVIWDRAMLERVFDFAYSWEVYTPVVKRKFGYYVIPVVYNNRFVARFEPEAVSKSGSFTIKNWWWETEITPDDKMRNTILKEMSRFSEYLKVECNKDNVKKLE